MNGLGWWALGALVVLLVAVWPRHGAIARARHRATTRAHEQGDNALKHLLQESHAGRTGSFASLKGTLRLRDRALLRVLERLRASGLTASEGGRYRLTADGELRARHLVRAHRLLERYLADEARLPLTSVHRVAERLEHTLSEQDAERLSASLGHPERDPHGDPIPSAGESSDDPGDPITVWPVGQEGRIAHLEDEPAAIFRALVHLGLEPGQAFRIVRATPDAMHLVIEGRDVTLPLEHAGNVFVAPIEGEDADAHDVLRLSELAHEQEAEVVSLATTCQGLTRRRLLDLGFTPGTRLRPVLDTFAGDPRAYRVRGTTIALRRDQSSVVIVRPIAGAALQEPGMRHQA
jgi:DtxR family Mn-dependent transcriptional regulator